jgi:PAS domain S-box-containing protein
MAEDIHVLCVDDEPDVLELGKVLLEKRNEFSVDTALSAPAALEILSRKTYDAIVADYQMPEMNGIDFLKKVRDLDKTVPFILFTGRGREEVVIEALNNGADFYLQKGSVSQTEYVELSHVIRQTVRMRRTQLTLAEQEERYHDILNSSDLIMSVAPDGQFLFVNRKWLDTLGYLDEEIRNLTLIDIIHEDCIKYFRDTFRKIISGDNVGIIDTAFRTRSGNRIFVEGMASCRTVAGKCQYIRGVFRDVTARKEAENGLIESEHTFSTIFDNSPYPIAITSVPDSRVMDVNKALLNASGYTREELLGKSVTEIGLYSPADADMLHSRMIQDGKIENEPILMTVKGGKEKHVLLSVIPITIRDRPANVTMIVEITNLKRAEEELLLKNRMLTEIEKELRANYQELLRREQEMSVSERRFRRLFENLPVGLVHGRMIYDENGNPDDYIYLETNEAFSELTGLVNVTGKRVTEVIPGIKAMNPELFEIIGRVARTGKPEKFEFNFKPLGKWNNITVYSMEKNYFVAIFDDFTDKKRIEEALQQVNKKLNLLSSITRHDINNKLLALDGFMALLHQKMPGLSDEILFFRISETSKQIAAMIRFTKDYEKIGVNAPAWQDLKDLVNNAEKSATPGEVTLTNELPAGTEVFADPLIIKVFFNLIDNALRHGGEITTIRFTLEDRNQDRVIVCEDDGDGIRSELKEKIFERGFGKNTGFGLFISREILDITGLTIKETGEPGTGARFEITVPERQFRFTATSLADTEQNAVTGQR